MKALRTAQMILARRALALRKHRRRRMPPQLPPRLIEMEYTRTLIRVLARVREAFQPLLDEMPHLLESAARDRSDSVRLDAGEGRRARELAQRAREKLAGTITPREIERLAELFGQRTETWQRVQLNKQTQAAFGADVFAHGLDRGLRALVDGFAQENVALIKGVIDAVAARIEQATTRAIASGTLHKDLAVELRDTFGYGESRAKLIARDQVGKLYGQINAQRQKSLGVRKFVWRTVHDERVRPEHEELDGEIFSYDDLPDEGLPGTPIQCRCYAEPVLDDIFDALDEE